MDAAPPIPRSPSDLIRLDPSGTFVTDADEETFELYSNLANTGSHDETPARKGGLGFLDSTKDVMEIELTLVASKVPNESAPIPGASKGRTLRTHRSKKPEGPREKTVSAVVHQDIGALRNRKGDTGSVVWRASLFLAEFLLQQFHFPLPSITPLLDPMRAKSTSVLELGAGTGLSSILLHGIFGRWTATDQFDNLKLISRNLRENGLEDVVRVKEVDWFRSLDKPTTTMRGGSNGEGLGGQEGYDLVLAIDCIYNEALIKPLVATFDRYTIRGRTLVWVVIELRSSDVISAFLEEWLAHDGWSIYRLGEDAMGPQMARGFVGWVGWRR